MTEAEEVKRILDRLSNHNRYVYDEAVGDYSYSYIWYITVRPMAHIMVRSSGKRLPYTELFWLCAWGGPVNGWMATTPEMEPFEFLKTLADFYPEIAGRLAEPHGLNIDQR
jgi:hypothetical protein